MKERIKKLVSVMATLVLALSMAVIMTACGNNDNKPVDNSVKSVTLSSVTADIIVGDVYTLTAVTDPSGRSVSFSSDNPDIASVSEDGIVSALSAGKAKITATSEEKSASCEITVIKPDKELSFTRTEYPLKAGQQTDVVLAVVNGEEGDIVTFSTVSSFVTLASNTAVLSSNGSARMAVTGVSGGTAEIMATLGEKSVKTVVTVTDVYSFNMENIATNNEFILSGQNYPINFEYKINGAVSEDLSKLKFSSSNTDIATVSNMGVISTVGSGSVSITAVVEEIRKEIVFDVYYGIGTATAWATIKNDLGGLYVLTSDIDFLSADVTTIAPYGRTEPNAKYYPTKNTFAGVLDGNGYTLKNFTPTSDASDNMNALFGATHEKAVIKNLSVLNVNLKKCSSAIVVWNEGLVENIYFEVKSTSMSNTNKNNVQAGVVAKNQGKGRVRGCIGITVATVRTNDGAVSPSPVVYGVVGYNNATATVTDCYFVSNQTVTAETSGTASNGIKKFETIDAIYAEDFSHFPTEWIKTSGALPKLKNFKEIASITSDSPTAFEVVLGADDYNATLPVASDSLYTVAVTGSAKIEYKNNAVEVNIAHGSTQSGVITLTALSDKTCTLTFTYTIVSALNLAKEIKYDITKGGALEIVKADYGIVGSVTAVNIGANVINFTDSAEKITLTNLTADSGYKVYSDAGIKEIAIRADNNAYSGKLLMATKIIMQKDLGEGIKGAPLKLSSILFSGRAKDNEPFCGYFILGEDIVLDETVDYTWPCTLTYNEDYFDATLDGRGHSISGLKIGVDKSLLGYPRNATIQNIAFLSASLVGQKSGVVATMTNKNTVIKNIYAEVNIKVNANSNAGHPTGAIVQKNNGKVQNCIALVDCTASSSNGIGGIVGNSSASSSVTDCILISSNLSEIGSAVSGAAKPTDNYATCEKVTNSETFYTKFDSLEKLTSKNYDHNIWNFDILNKTIGLKKL